MWEIDSRFAPGLPPRWIRARVGFRVEVSGCTTITASLSILTDFCEMLCALSRLPFKSTQKRREEVTTATGIEVESDEDNVTQTPQVSGEQALCRKSGSDVTQ